MRPVRTLTTWTLCTLMLGAAAAPLMAQPAETTPGPGPSPDAVAKLDVISSAFRDVARKVRPAVVMIQTTMTTKTGGQPKSSFDPKDLPEQFREFFKDFEGQTPEEVPQIGRGSGAIIDAKEGYILTNNHVVGRKDDKERVRIDVTLADGRNAQADIVGQDPKTDLALIRLKPEDLQRLTKAGPLIAITIGESDSMEVGDWVVAVGAPFGLAQTVTQGIISAKGRNMVGIAGIEDFIQTDAAINPGNSGGPLVSMRGELIGVNTAIATSGLTRGYMGVGLAIPSRMITELLPDLKEGRKIVRGYLGISIVGLEMKPGLAATFGLDSDRGVLVEGIRPDTPAAKGGLKEEDVILAINGTNVESVGQLQNIVAKTKPGNSVHLKVWRDGKEINIPVEIGEQPDNFYDLDGTTPSPGGRSPGGGSSETAEIDPLGMTVAKITEQLATKYKWDYEEVQGQLIVTHVEPLGEAAALRISAGDLIVSVQGVRIKAISDLRKALSPEALDRGVRLRVQTDQGIRTILIQIGRGTSNGKDEEEEEQPAPRERPSRNR